MLTLFQTALQKVKEDFSNPDIIKRLETLTVQVIASDHMAKNLRTDNYKRYANIPAYYDPNSKTIFLNGGTLPEMDDLTVFIICYHELMHGISLHKNYQDEDSNVFQSGIKVERFGKKSYFCANRLLNEGIVQFLTTHNNEVDANDYAYSFEVRLVRKIAATLGIRVIVQALLDGSYDKLETAFNTRYGQKSFTRFTKLLDKRKYDEAEAILNQVEESDQEQLLINNPFSSKQEFATT